MLWFPFYHLHLWWKHFLSLRWKCVLSWKTYKRDVWSRLRTSSDGTSWSNMTLEIYFRKNIFLLVGTSGKVLLFKLYLFVWWKMGSKLFEVQFVNFKKLWAHFFVSFRPSSSSLNMPENGKTKILMSYNKSC